MRSRLTAEEIYERYGAVTETERHHALLDVVQDHFLFVIYRLGLFNLNKIVRFIGGTSARKNRFGHDKRISHDIDLTAASQGARERVLALLDGVTCEPFVFRIVPASHPLTVVAESAILPGGQLSFKLDISTEDREAPPPRITPPVHLPLLPMPASDLYSFDPNIVIPTLAVEENIAEKLCRQYFKPLPRDTYDVAHLKDILIAKAPLIAKLAARSMSSGRGKGGFVTQHPKTGKLIITNNYTQITAKAFAQALDGDRRDRYMLDFVPSIDDDTLIRNFRKWREEMIHALVPFHKALLADERLTVISFRKQRKMSSHIPSPVDGITPADITNIVSELDREILAAVAGGEFTDIPSTPANTPTS